MDNPLLHKTAAPMDRSKVMEALKATNNILSEKGLTESVTVVGGAAIMFLFPDFDREVKDIDGCDMSETLISAVEQVAWEVEGLSDMWFNNTCNLYIQPKEKAEGPQLSNLHILTPTKEYLLCLKLKAGRTEEDSNDARDVEFMVEHMPRIQSEKDWQRLYKEQFGTTDWKPWMAERANIAINRKTVFDKAAGAEPNQQRPAEPLLKAMINQSEWKRQEKVHIFTEPEDDMAELNGVKLSTSEPGSGDYAITTDRSGRFWGNEGAGVVFWCPSTRKVLVGRRSEEVNEPFEWGTWGGEIDEGESPAEAAKREAHEEAGAEVESVDLVWTFQDTESEFRYHNFIVTVENEFVPKLSWETDDYRWVPLTSPPTPTHFGLKALWPHLKSWIGSKKTSSRSLLASADLVERAMEFAREAHASQARKYTGDPYFTHLEGVAAIVESVGGSPEMIAASYLHDCIEDQNVTAEELRQKFGPEVAKLVVEVSQVSKMEDGNRAKRKELDRQHYSQASADGQTIKLADAINNGYDIVDSNPKFARVYIPELEALIASLTSGNSTLKAKADKMIAYAKKKLAEEPKKQ